MIIFFHFLGPFVGWINGDGDIPSKTGSEGGERDPLYSQKNQGLDHMLHCVFVENGMHVGFLNGARYKTVLLETSYKFEICPGAGRLHGQSV